MRRISLAIAALAFVLPSAAAQVTWVVDDDPGPGVDFADLPQAVAAAGPWDILDVRAGNYTGTTVRRGLRILGSGTSTHPVSVSGTMTVRDVSSGEVFCAAGIRFDDVRIFDCMGVVVLEDCRCHRPVRISDSDDVRALRFDMRHPYSPNTAAITVEDSRLELVDSHVEGDLGSEFGQVDGGLAIDARRSTLHFAASEVIGGEGWTETTNFHLGNPGDGGDALHIEDTVSILSGARPADRVWGGAGGLLISQGLPIGSGYAGVGVVGRASSDLRVSDVWVEGQPAYDLDPTVALVFASNDPVLLLGGPVHAGQLVQVTVLGAPGDLVDLEFGRNAVRVPDPGSPIERLTSGERRAFLGTLPSSGERTITLMPPAAWPTGTLFFLQARVTDPTTGSVRRSNSTPFLVR